MHVVNPPDSGLAPELCARVREFVDTQVIPVEDALDVNDHAMWSAVRDRARVAGLWALPLPAAHGGGGLTLSAYFGVAEAEGRSDHGPGALGSAALLNVNLLTAHAGPELCSLVPDLVRGELGVSYAMTEPGVAGSDPAGLRTSGERVADGWVVSGRKWFTTAAADAGLVLVVARTDADAPLRRAFSMFAVPTSAPGFRVVREMDVLGAGGQYEIEFDNVRIPETHLVGTVGGGMAIAGERLALGRTLRAFRWIGQAQRAIEQLADRAATRRLGEGVLADKQLVQQLVFDAELHLRSARLLTAQAADAVARNAPAQVEVGFAKVAAARALTTAVDAAIQIHGAEGLTAASGLPCLLRTARAARILDGPDEFHITSTARRLIRAYTTPTGDRPGLRQESPEPPGPAGIGP